MKSILHQLIFLMQTTLQALGADCTPLQIERLCVTIHRAMNSEARQFHNIEHVLSFWNAQNPIQSLAAMYHDIVYYQVDRGLDPEVAEALSPYLQEHDGEMCIVGELAEADAMLHMVMCVFGVEKQRICTMSSGLNEFLSALYMVKKLEGVLSPVDLMRLTACIEASIPFRSAVDGVSPFELLTGRLVRLDEQMQLGMGTMGVEQTVHLAVGFANQDVASFAAADVSSFLGDTWKLLPETNVPLRSPDVYTVVDYRRALQRMETFTRLLNPQCVFHTYRGVPPSEIYTPLEEQARRNLEIATEYLQVKLLTVGILEALAEISGGDAPISLFTGDTNAVEGQRIEDWLPEMNDLMPLGWRSPEVVRLLQAGRGGTSEFDVGPSPVSLFWYRSLSKEQFRASFLTVQQFFNRLLTARAFLKSLDADLLRTTIWSVAAMATTRRDALMDFD